MLADWYKNLCAYHTQLMTNCPYAQYEGYAILGIFTLLFLLLWRWAARKNKALKGENRTLRYVVEGYRNGPTACQAQCCASPPVEAPAQLPCTAIFQHFYDMHTHSLDTLRAVGDDAMGKLAQANALALSHIDSVVRNFTESEEE